ncbi:transcription termination/antitermination protein NusA [Verrucomicrobia bacterium LW23]|nr:transcription termination/antitermination protein NusA [Verrucomicrobia bacterium LW23]
MSQDLISLLEYLEKEKGIKREDLIEAVQLSLVAAARKSFGPAKDLRVEIDPRSAKIKAIARLTVVEKVSVPHDEILLAKAKALKPDVQLGDSIEVEVNPNEFGRIAAQNFKQGLAQAIRNIERTMVLNEYKDRLGTIVTGTVRRFDRSDVIIDLGKFEALMPSKERVPTEDYAPNERIRAYVLAIEASTRGPEIILSRSHPDFVRKLFELEVSELVDKTIEIKAMAREAGYRTKIAVWSQNDKVDPVGACVGMRGARVKNIVRELNNEKVDLFRWSPNIRELVIEALKPAKLKSIEPDEKRKHVKIFVDDENYSLAIGRRGQNARLTQKLTGWEVEIQKQQTETVGFEQQLNKAVESLATILKIETAVAQQVVRAGFLSVDGIVEADEEDFLGALPDLDPAVATTIYAAAKTARS